jgi:uncharacterized membrane protein YgcG
VIDQTQLAEALGQLDAGTRALLDLSLRRAIPDDQVAKVLDVDAASIPPRRARGIAQLADIMQVPGPSELAALLIAIPDLPEEAWGVPEPAPFAGGVTAARRARAFKRVAIAASPLVALGAVMAAVLVSSSDHSATSSNASSAHGAGGGNSAGSALSAVAPDARHKLPAGVQLSKAERGSAHKARHAARHHRARRHAGGGDAQPATLARAPVKAVEHSVPVAFHPQTIVHHAPTPVIHHHHAPSKPKSSPSPTKPVTPAPVQTPSQPVSSTPAPTQTQPTLTLTSPQQQHTTTVHSTPAPTGDKHYKTPPPQPDLNPPGSGSYTHSSSGHGSSGGHGSGSCHSGYSGSRSGDGDGGHSYSHHQYGHDSNAGQHSGGRSFSPPGLFRKRHGH